MKGYRTIVVNALTAVAALTGIVPPEYQAYALLASAVANAILRFITDTPIGSAVTSLRAFLPIALVTSLVTASACSSTQRMPDLTRDCQLAQVVVAGFEPVLAAKCAQAKDPLTDGYCLAGVGVRTAIQACFVAADDGDAIGGVQKALEDVRDAKGQAGSA